MSRDKRTIAVDFDGVLHEYNGYQNGLIQGAQAGAWEAVKHLRQQGHTVVVFTTRSADLVARWLKDHGFPELEVSNVKRPFWAIVDDRAIRFDGNWERTLAELEDFEPFWVRRRREIGT